MSDLKTKLRDTCKAASHTLHVLVVTVISETSARFIFILVTIYLGLPDPPHSQTKPSPVPAIVMII